MSHKLARYCLTLTVFVLGALLSLHAYKTYRQSTSETQPEPPPLAEVVAQEVPGWHFQELPLANNEAQMSEIKSILNFTDALYAEYANSRFRVELYVAYWKPGIMPYDLVGYHVPDVCWVATGWKQLARSYAVDETFASGTLKPYEFGRYEKNGRVIDVIFWHTIGEKTVRYDHQGEMLSPWGKLKRMGYRIADALEYGIGSYHPQYLIRISSTTPMEVLMENRDFRRLLRALVPLGIWQAQSTPESADVPDRKSPTSGS